MKDLPIGGGLTPPDEVGEGPNMFLMEGGTENTRKWWKNVVLCRNKGGIW